MGSAVFLTEIDMGMDLFGKHGGAMFNWHGWRECMERAFEFGWTPKGPVAATVFPVEWEGSPLAPSLHQGMEGRATC
jgi:hypothetical protein